MDCIENFSLFQITYIPAYNEVFCNEKMSSNLQIVYISFTFAHVLLYLRSYIHLIFFFHFHAVYFKRVSFKRRGGRNIANIPKNRKNIISNQKGALYAGACYRPVYAVHHFFFLCLLFNLSCFMYLYIKLCAHVTFQM